MLRLHFTILLFLAFSPVWAQQIDEQVFRNICAATVKSAKQVELQRGEFVGFYIVEEPISGTREIRHYETVAKRTVEQFNKYSKEEQFSILNADTLPIFPLKRTVYIVDTANHLHADLSTEINGHVFRVIRKKSDVKEPGTYLYPTGARVSAAILCLGKSAGLRPEADLQKQNDIFVAYVEQV
jgi:hypothetical protein